MLREVTSLKDKLIRFRAYIQRTTNAHFSIIAVLSVDSNKTTQYPVDWDVAAMEQFCARYSYLPAHTEILKLFWDSI